MNKKALEDSYQMPVRRLLSLGKFDDGEWYDYQQLVSREHIPELIRLATDERLLNVSEDNSLAWARFHAWRALGQFQATEAVVPLFSLFRLIDELEDNMVESELPGVLGEIGMAALEPAASYLADNENGDWARITAADTLCKLGQIHPDLRAECVARLSGQLEKFQDQRGLFNAFLIVSLQELHAVEAMPIIERAHAANRVDESVLGDAEDMQIHFGLKKEREIPRKLGGSDRSPEISYHPPLSRLLSLGEPDYLKWDDYTAFDISSKDIPELIRMATDEALHEDKSDSDFIWAPIHAWRALGRLQAVEAVAPLLSLFQMVDDAPDDWIHGDLPKALARIGRAAFEPVVDYLANEEYGEWPRVVAANTLGELGQTHPELREECIGKLAAQLTRFKEQSATLNAFLVSPLWDLNAVEAMPILKLAHDAGCVDESINGDLEDIEIHFGLKKKREFPAKPNALTELQAEFAREMAALQHEEDEAFSMANALASAPASQPYIAPPKVGRNEPCPCGSGKKYKRCCGG